MRGLFRKEVLLETGQKIGQAKQLAPFYIRKVARSGNSRSMSVSNILPGDWLVVKIIVMRTAEGVRELRIQEIK